jgi:hypothetical protein
MILREEPDLRRCEIIWGDAGSNMNGERITQAGCINCLYEDMCPHFNPQSITSMWNLMKHVVEIEKVIKIRKELFENNILPE